MIFLLWLHSHTSMVGKSTVAVHPYYTYTPIDAMGEIKRRNMQTRGPIGMLPHLCAMEAP